jgi:hypothetical protein
LQLPEPLQEPTGVSIAFEHVAVPHEVPVPAFLHAPAPSHVPTNPQGGLGVQRPCGSAASAGTSLHVPSWPMTLHAWQVPHEAVAQQTPSTHELPVRQSASAEHGSPSRCLSPHLFFWRSQIAGDAQSVSAVQVVLQAAPSQLYGAQDCVVAGLHVPVPSHARPSV